MSKLSRALAITLLAASVPAGIVLAQAGHRAARRPPAAEDSDGPRGPSPEIAGAPRGRTHRHGQGGAEADARAGEAVGAGRGEDPRRLRRAPQDARGVARQARGAPCRPRQGRASTRSWRCPSASRRRSERMAERATKMNERAAKTKEFAEVVKPLYASLSDEQKEVADPLLRRFAQDGGGRTARRSPWTPLGHGLRAGTAGPRHGPRRSRHEGSRPRRPIAIALDH